MMTKNNIKQTFCIAVLLLPLLILFAGCSQKTLTPSIDDEHQVRIGLSALLKGTISLESPNDNNISRLLVCIVPKTLGKSVILDLNTNSANTPVQIDNSDPTDPKSYITIGTKWKALKTDEYEIALPQAGYYHIMYIANPTVGIIDSILNRPLLSVIDDVFYKNRTYSESNKDYSNHIRMMSRIYYDQKIESGTKNNPFLWRPTLSGIRVFLPVSSFPEAYLEDNGYRVGLLRSMAKFDITINSINPACLNTEKPSNLKITLFGVPTTYTLAEKPWNTASTSINLTLYDAPWDGSTNVVLDSLFVPEKVFSKTNPPDWVAENSVNGTLYAQIEITKVKAIDSSPAGNMIFKFPLLTATKAQMQSMTENKLRYTDLMIDRDADYNLYRNRHYIYTVSLPWYVENQTLNINFSSTAVQELMYDIPIFNWRNNNEVK
jgi:hypothetical protein